MQKNLLRSFRSVRMEVLTRVREGRGREGLDSEEGNKG